MLRKLWFVVIVYICFSLLVGEDVLRFTIGEWPPYSSQSLEGYGIIPQIVTAAYKEVGIEVKYEWMPWNRALEIIKSDYDYSGSLGWVDTEERKEFYNFSVGNIVVDRQVFFHKKDFDFSWKTYEDLNGLRVGHTLGYAVLGALKKAEEENIVKLDIADSDIINFRKLIYGRVNIFDCNFVVGYNILAREFSAADRLQVTNHPKFLSESFLKVAVSKNHPNVESILKKFDEGLEIIKENGVYDEILKIQ